MRPRRGSDTAHDRLVGTLMELSWAVAWKEFGRTAGRYAAIRRAAICIDRSYIVARNVPGLDDGLHHYLSRDHALEQRCRTTGLPERRTAVDRPIVGALRKPEIW